MSNNRMPSPKSNLRASFVPSSVKAVGVGSPTNRNTDKKDPSLFTSIGPGSKSPLVKLATEPTVEKPPVVQSPKAKTPAVVETKPKPTTQPTKQVGEPASKLLPPAQKKDDLRMTYAANSTTSKDLLKGDAIRKSVLSPSCKPKLVTDKEPKEATMIGTQPASGTKLKHDPVSSLQGQLLKSPTSKLAPTISSQPPKTKVQPVQQHAQKKEPHTIGGFAVGKTVGVGRFGEVYLAKHQQLGFVSALKKLNKAKVREANCVQQMIDQIKLLSCVNNPNIVQFYGCISDAENVYLVLEFLEGGTLANKQHVVKKLQEVDTALVVREISIALKDLQDLNVTHRQVKAENVVLCYGIAKLCGFGWVHRNKKPLTTDGNKSNNSTNSSIIHEEHSGCFDTWCLGIIAFELLTGKEPFDTKHKWLNMLETVDASKIEYPADLSKQATDFLQMLFRKHSPEPLRAEKILAHPFLNRPEINKTQKQV